MGELKRELNAAYVAPDSATGVNLRAKVSFKLFLSTVLRGACRRTGGVRPSPALRELLQRGVSEALTGRVDSLRCREIAGHRRPNRRDVLDNTRESDITRSDVVPT